MRHHHHPATATSFSQALSGVMVMMGGVGAGGSGGDDAWAREGNGNGNGDGNGKAPVRENNRRPRRESRRRLIASRILAGLREHDNYTRHRKGSEPPAGDHLMAVIGGSAPVNPDGASRGPTQPSSLSAVTLGGGVSDGADPVPAWLRNLSKQLSDPNFFASSCNSNASTTPQNGSPPSSLPHLRKKPRYSSPPPTPPPSPARASNALPLPWATGAGASRHSFQTSTPKPMSPITGRAPGAGSGGVLLFRRSRGEQAGAREEEVMTEKNADEKGLGNEETRKDRA